MADVTELVTARISRNTYWRRLGILRSEYEGSILGVKAYTVAEFNTWVKDTYGLVINFDSMGNITSDYTVSDEHKYLLFLLKYGHRG